MQVNMQKNTPSLVFHRRLIITTEINNPINYKNNVSIECSLLKEGGDINKKQELRLYHVGDVSLYVTRK